ncbi:MAG: prepilin peptidase [Planctomycetia bacterium]|nr:prepilin peptidase [Planctomycetia bacterium]
MWLQGQIDWFVILIAVWLCSVGGVIGSFLNVVIYRLPLGMSLVRPASRCPACLTPILWYDNLPVFGWLWLRGRCRECGAAISPRYPAVEALVACFFVALAASEFCFGGERDPFSAAAAGFHLPWASDLSATGIWMRYWAQVLLAVTLLAAGLMERDGSAVPFRLCRPTLLFAIAMPFVWREVRPFPYDYQLVQRMPSGDTAFQQPLDLLFGAWAGLIIALLAWSLINRDQRGSRPMKAALLAIGVTLGWQLTAMIGVFWLTWLGLRTAFAGSAERRGGLLPLAIVACFTLLAWRPLLSAALAVAARSWE